MGSGLGVLGLGFCAAKSAVEVGRWLGWMRSLEGGREAHADPGRVEGAGCRRAVHSEGRLCWRGEGSGWRPPRGAWLPARPNIAAAEVAVLI